MPQLKELFQLCYPRISYNYCAKLDKVFLIFALLIIVSCNGKSNRIPEEYIGNWALHYLTFEDSNILNNESELSFITNLMIIDSSKKIYINNKQNNLIIKGNIIFYEDYNNIRRAKIMSSSDPRLNGIYEVEISKEVNGIFKTFYLTMKSESISIYAEKRTN